MEEALGMRSEEEPEGIGVPPVVAVATMLVLLLLMMYIPTSSCFLHKGPTYRTVPDVPLPISLMSVGTLMEPPIRRTRSSMLKWEDSVTSSDRVDSQDVIRSIVFVCSFCVCDFQKSNIEKGKEGNTEISFP